MIRKLLFAMLGVMLLGGCVTAMIENDRTRTVTEAALVGGGAGALVGGLIGEFVKDQPVLGAIVGGIIGSAGGGLYGNHVANKKEEFVRKEDYLDACILEAERISAQTYQYNASLRSEVRALNDEVNTFINLYNRNQLGKVELEREQEKIQATFKNATAQLKRATDELLIQREVRRREQNQQYALLSRLDEKIKRLEQLVSELGQHTQALASINQRLRG